MVRPIKDRNYLFLGVPTTPDAEVEEVRMEVENLREVVRPTVEHPRVNVRKNTVVPNYSPPAPLLNLDALSTTPQIFYQSVSSFANLFDDIEDCTFVVDPSNGLGAGADAVFVVSTFPESPSYSQYILTSHNKYTNTTTRYFPSPPNYLSNGASLFVGFVLNGYTLHAIGDKIYGSESSIIHADPAMPYFDLSQADLGTTPSGFGNFLPFTSGSPGGFIGPNVYKINISGTPYLVAGDDRYVYNPVTDTWSGPIPLPPGANDFRANGQYMWARSGYNLYSATASLTPTWTLVATLSFSQGLPILDGSETCVSPLTGELFFLQQRVIVGSSPTSRHYRLNSIDFTTGTRTVREDIFGAPNGLPASGIIYDTQFAGTAPIHPGLLTVRLAAGTDFVAILGAVRSDALGTTISKESSSSEILWVPAVWTVQGSGPTLDTVATLVTHSDLSLNPTPTSATWANMVYGHIEAVGNKLYTWLGWTLFEASPVPDVYVESRIREWEIG